MVHVGLFKEDSNTPPWALLFFFSKFYTIKNQANMKKGLSFFVLALLVITGHAVAIDESSQSITKEKTVHTNNALWRTIKFKSHETLWTGNNLQTSSNSITTIQSDLTSTTEAVTGTLICTRYSLVDNDGGGSCSSQSDCNWQGNCLNNECYCFPLYSGL